MQGQRLHPVTSLPNLACIKRTFIFATEVDLDINIPFDFCRQDLFSEARLCFRGSSPLIKFVPQEKSVLSRSWGNECSVGDKNAIEWKQAVKATEV